MLLFVLGVVVGMIWAGSILLVEVYLRERTNNITHVIDKVEQKFKPKGAVIPAPTEADEARAHIKQMNDEQGKDTPLSDLQ